MDKLGQRIKKGSDFHKLDSSTLRVTVLLAVLFLGAYAAFFQLGVGDWNVDEPEYRDAGLEYIQDNSFKRNTEHPFLAKYILGITQVALGSSEREVVRIPSALASLLTGLVLFVFARRVAGYWTGVLALGLWTISPLTVVWGRLAILESFLALFGTLALYLGWRWAESHNWGFAASAGVAIGLATASKALGILFLPAILFAGLIKIGMSRPFIYQSLLLGLAAGATALATYIPAWSEALPAIRGMFSFQLARNATGHPEELNGELYYFPPWWAHLEWQWEFYGTLATLSLGVAIVIGLLRHRPIELYLLTAILVPFLLLSFYMQFKLNHYFYTWQPPLILLLALAAERLARRGIAGPILTFLLVAPFAYLGIEAIQTAKHLQPFGYAAVAKHLENTGYDRGPILTSGWDAIVRSDFPNARILKSPLAIRATGPARGSLEDIQTIIVQENVDRRFPKSSIKNYLTGNSDKFELSYRVVPDRNTWLERAYGTGEIEVYTRKPER